MEIQRFLNFLAYPLNEAWKHNDKHGIHIEEPPLLSKSDGVYPKLPNALNHNSKNMFYSFDLTNKCNRGCPGCYVGRAGEIQCNAVADIPIKEYKGDLREWADRAKSEPNSEFAKNLKDTIKQVNANGGIRMFSAADYPQSSDASYVKILDMAGISDKNYFKNQVTKFLNDCHYSGFHAKAITKEISLLTDHIDHPALKGVDVSMNAQGFGESHESVKKMRSGTHEELSAEDNKKLAKHAKKIMGRTVTHTPFDLLEVIKHVNLKDDSHIGVITSAHDIPVDGVRYQHSKPKDDTSPKNIVIQVNFPDRLMHLLNGDGDIKTKEVIPTDNSSEISSEDGDNTDNTDADERKNFKQVDKNKDGLADSQDFSYLTFMQLLEATGDKNITKVLLHKVDGRWIEHKNEGVSKKSDEFTIKIDKNGKEKKVYKYHPTNWDRNDTSQCKGKSCQDKSCQGGSCPTKTISREIDGYEGKFDEVHNPNAKEDTVVQNLEENFIETNPEFPKLKNNKYFDVNDANALIAKCTNRMCCAGRKTIKGVEHIAKGKCHNCTAKCGVRGKDDPTINARNEADVDLVVDELNTYAKKYNNIRNKALAAIHRGTIEVLTTNIKEKDPKIIKPDGDKPQRKYTKTPEHDKKLDKRYDYDIDYDHVKEHKVSKFRDILEELVAKNVANVIQ